MFDKSEKFPDGWFFIKNHSNGYVLMVDNESQEVGSPVVLSSLRTKDYSAQLWRYDPSGYLVNKKSGQVMDVAKGNAKAGVDIVQQILSKDVKEENNYQKFGLSPHGHIYLINKSNLVLGIKESFFARREGLHVHLQLIDKRHLDKKEQRWDFVLPVIKEKTEPAKRSISTFSNTSNSKLSAVAQIKEDDARSVRSSTGSVTSIDQDEANRVPTGSFPDTPFFLKSDASGFYVSTETATSTKAGSQLTIESLRKKAYESQLWTYEPTTCRIVNKMTKLVLGIENNAIKDGSDICQVTSSPAQDKTQAWTLSAEGEITLKSDPSFVIGFKESWFGNREGAHLHLQKKNGGHQNQKFTVVLPVFKKSEAVKVEQKGVFPEGWFFVKSQAHGLVLTVLETGVIAAEVEATKLDTSNYARQLWKFDNGFLVNKASEMVLDIRGGSIASGATICQYTKKTEDAENQKWGLTVEGSIHPESNKGLALTVKEDETVRSSLYLAERKTCDNKGQCWNFVLPVFKKKQVTTTVKQSFKTAAYPSGWFFIRSHVKGSTTESPYVLTATEKSIELTLLDRENWQSQLWSYSNGQLINYATDLMIDVNSFSAGSELIQNSKASEREWIMTMEGYLLHGSNEQKFVLGAELIENNKYRLIITTHKQTQDFRWGFLIPKFGYRSGYQILIQWSIHILREYRKTITTTTTVKTTTVDHPIAEWPQGEFFIRGSDGYALVPEKHEPGALVIMKKLEIENADIFKWTYRNGYLVHVISRLVLRIQDKLVEGARLSLAKETEGDEYQHWILKTNGSIVSKKDQKYGLNLVQVNGVWTILISTTYYAWKLLYGRYETRYSETENREVSYLVSFQRIVLTLWVTRKHDGERKLVTRTIGIFPKGWMFIRSKCDANLFITVSDKKKGAKLILHKLDTKGFTRQLWRYRDDGCLVNMETDYVIDVAGGKLTHNANIIQWSSKFLRSSRKNQVWGLSVEGHIHTQSNPDLVLASVGDHAKEGSALKLVKRGNSSLAYQQWTFAYPLFKSTKYTTYASQQAHRHSLVLEKVGDTTSIDVSKDERYERITKRVVTRRWAVFPTEKFFIRMSHGDKKLALTVEYDESLSYKYRIVIRTLNFKSYKWQLWSYQDGYLVNEQTGLVLDAQLSEDVSIEGAQSQIYLKEKSSNEGQYWDLGVNGEIHLRSNERLTIGVAKSEDASVEGAVVGLRKVRLVRSETDSKQVTTLKSDEWLRWSFSKPVFGTRTIATESGEALEIERCDEQAAVVQEQDEELHDEEEEEEEEEEEVEETEEHADESEYEIQTPIQTPSSSSKTSTTAGVAIVGAGVVAGAAAAVTEAIKSETVPSKESTTVTTTTTEKVDDATVVKVEKTVTQALQSSSKPNSRPGSRHGSRSNSPSGKSNRSERLTRKDSFQLEDNYVPTGFEKVVRYKNHHGNFPNGYFFIKSSLHGFVLDLVEDAHDGVYVVMTRMKTTDFASQLWSYDNGFLINLKGRHLVLDASTATLLAAGERLHLSTRNSPDEGYDDQTWEYSHEGLIHLKSKRSIVLSLKELKRSDKHVQIDIYCQEAKPLIKKQARPEQHWEVLIPSLIPVKQGESGVKIVESGKIESVTSSASAVVCYKWIKETYLHKVTAENQWPGTEGWFFIRFGSMNHFLASGETAQSEVGLYEITEKSDYKRFLWTYVDGYLINYKYMLRLILSTSRRWILSNSHSTLSQKFYISSNGLLSIRISKTIYYIRFIIVNGIYKLDVTSDSSVKETQGLEFHIPVVSDAEYQKNLVYTYSTAYTWIRKQKADWALLTTTTSTRRALFPVNTWFFVKVSGAEDLVLTVTSDESKSPLILKKLDFRAFKSQLWTFNDGHLINYGNKFVIDVEGTVDVLSKVIISRESAISTQKWILTTEGHIELDSHDYYILGAEEIKEGSSIVLGSSKTSSKVNSIQWKFSTPVFGKRTVTANTESTTMTTPKPIETSDTLDITKAIEQGAVIESVEEVATVNKSSLALTRRSTKTSVDTYCETRVIIRWWRIIFIRRISTCRTQKEYMQVLDEYRQLLHNRFIQYLTIYRTSVSGSELRAIEEFVNETQDTLEKEVFTKTITYLNGLKEEDVVSTKEFDLVSVVSQSCDTIEKKLDIILDSKKETTVEKITDIEVVEQQSETETVDRVVITIETIHIVIRRWVRILYRRIDEASQKGAKPEEIQKLIESSKQELSTEITKLETSAKDTVSKSSYVSGDYKKQLEQSISTVVESSKNELDRFVSNVDIQQVNSYTEDSWRKITQTFEDSLTTKIQACKNSVEEYETVTEVEEQDVTVDEKEVESTKMDVVTAVAETKAYLTSWFSTFLKDVTWSVDQSVEDTVTVVDAAKLEAVSKIDETISLISMLSGRLSYLTWIERRRLITYLITVKTFLMTNIDQFKTEISTADKETTLKICHLTFGEDQQKDVLKNIDYVVEKVSSKTTTAETVSEEEIVTTTVEVIHKDAQPTATDVTESKILKAAEADRSTVTTEVIRQEEQEKAPVKTEKKDSIVKDIAVGAGIGVAAGVATGIIAGISETSHKATDVEIVKSETEVVKEVEKAPGFTTTIDTDKTKVDTAVIAGKVLGTVTGEIEKTSDVTEVEVIATETAKTTEGEITKVESGVIAVDTAEDKSKIVSSGVVSGAVTETIVNDKDTITTIGTIVKDTDSVTVEVIAGDKKTETVVDTTTVTDKVKDTVTAGVIAGAVTETIVADKEVTSIVDTIVKESDTVDVNVIVGDKETKTVTDKTTTTSGSQIDVIVKETDKVIKTEEVTEVTEEVAEVVDVVKDAVTGTIVADKEISTAVDTIVKESDSVTVEVIAGDKKTETVVDTTTVTDKVKDTVTAGVIAGAVTETIVADREVTSIVDTIVKESDTVDVNVIVGDKETKTITDKTTTTSGSQIDVIVKESDVIVGEKGTVIKTEEVTEVTEEVAEVVDVVKDAVTGTIVADKEISTAVDTIVKESDSVTVEVIAGDKKTETVVDTTTVTDKVKDTVTAGVIAGAVTETIVADREVTSIVDTIVKESDTVDVNIIVGDKETKTVTDKTTTTSGSQIDVIVKETDKVIKTEEVTEVTEEVAEVVDVVKDAVTGTIVADKEISTAVDTIVKESDSVTVEVIAGDKKTETVVDTTTVTDKVKDTVTAGVIAGAVTETIVADKEVTSIVDTIVKESDTVDVNVIVGDKETKTITDKTTTTSGSQIDVIVKESDVIVGEKGTVIKTEEATEVSKVETAGGVIAGTVTEAIVKDKDVASTIGAIVKNTESVTVEVISGDKKVETVVDTSDIMEIISKVETDASKTDVVETVQQKKETDTEKTISKTDAVAAGIVAGAVAEAIIKDKSSGIEATVDESETTVVKVISGDKKSETVVGDVGTKSDSSNVDVIVKETVSGNVTAVEETKDTKASGIISGVVTEVISSDKEISSITDSIAKESEFISVEVIAGDKKAETVVDTKEIASEDVTITADIVTGGVRDVIAEDKTVASITETIVKDSDSVSIGVVTGDKNSETVISVDDKIIVGESATSVEIVETREKTTAPTIADKVTETIITDDKVSSAIESVVHEADSVTVEVITGDKKAGTTIDTSAIRDSASKAQVVGEKTRDNADKLTSIKEIATGVIAGAVVEAVASDSKTETIITEIDTVSVEVIKGDKKIESVRDTDAKDKVNVIIKESDASTDEVKVADTVSTEAVTAGVITGAVVEAICKDEETAKVVDSIVKESKDVTVDVVVGDRIEGETSITKVNVIVKEVEVSSDEVIDTKDATVVPEMVSEGIVDVVAGAVTETIVSNKEISSKLDTAIKESDAVVVEVIAGDKKTGTIVDVTSEEVTTGKADVVIKDKPTVETVEKKETTEATVGGIITGAVTEAIVSDKEVSTTIGTIVKEFNTVTAGADTTDKKTEAVKTATEEETVLGSTVDVVKQKSDIVVEKTQDISTVEVIGVIAGTVAESVTKDKDVVSTIDMAAKKSDNAFVEVAAGDKTSQVVVGQIKDKDSVTTIEEAESTVVSVEVTGNEDISTSKKTDTTDIVGSDVDVIDKESITQVVKKTEAITAGIVAGAVTETVVGNKETISVIEEIVRKSGNVTVEVVTDKTGSQDNVAGGSKIGIIVKESDKVTDTEAEKVKTDVTGTVAGAVVEAIVSNKETSSAIEAIIKESDSVHIEVITGETIIQNVIDVTDVTVEEEVTHETVSAAEAITAGVVASGVVAAIVGNETVSSNVETIVKGSESVEIEVVAVGRTPESVDVTEGQHTSSQIGVVVKESTSAEKKPIFTKDKVSIGSTIARTIVQSVLDDKKTASAVESTIKKFDSVSIQVAAGNEKTETVIDTTTVTGEIVSDIKIDVIEKIEQDTVTAGVIAGAVTETIVADKEVTSIVDTIVKESDTVDVNIIVGDKETKTVTDKTTTTSGSQIDVIVKETDKVIKTEEVTEVTEEVAEVVDVVKDAVTGTIVADKEISTAVDTIVKESDSVTVEVIAGDKKTETVVDTTTVTDKVKDTVTAGVIAGAVTETIVADKEVTSIVDTIVKESDTVDVNVIVGDKETKTVTDKTTTTSGSQIDVIVKETDKVIKTEEVTEVTEEVAEVVDVVKDAVTGTIVADKEISTAVDTIVKESDSVTVEVIAGDKKTETVVDTTTVTDKVKDTVTAGVIAGAVTETIVADKEVTSIVDTIVKESDTVDVNVIVGDKETKTITDKTTTTSGSQIDVIVKESDVIVGEKGTVIKTEEVTEVTEEVAEVVDVVKDAVTGTIVADKEISTAVDTIVKESDSVTVEVIAGDKKTEAVVDTTDIQQTIEKVDVTLQKSTSDIVEEVTKEKIVSDVALGKETITAGAIAGTVSKTIVEDKEISSAVETAVKESGSVAIEVVAGEKKTTEVISVAPAEETATEVSKVEVIVKPTEVISTEKETTEVVKTEDIVIGVIAGTTADAIVKDKETLSTVETIVKETGAVAIDVVKQDSVEEVSEITDVETTESKIDIVVKKPAVTSEAVAQKDTVTGAVVGAIVNDKDVSSTIEAIVKGSETVNVEVIADKEQSAEKVTEVSTGSEVIVEEKEVISVTDVVSKSQETAPGIIAGAVTEVIVDNKEVSTAVEKTVKESDAVVIEVITGEKKFETVVDTTTTEETLSKVDTVTDEKTADNTITKSELVTAAIVAGAVAEVVADKKEVFTDVVEVGKTTVEVVAGDKKADTTVSAVTEDEKVTSDTKIEVIIKEADVSSTEQALTEKEEVVIVDSEEVITTGAIAGTVTEAVINDKNVKLEDIAKKTDTVDVTVTTSTTASVTSSDTTAKKADVSVDSKVDVIVKESDITNAEEVVSVDTISVVKEPACGGFIAGGIIGNIVKDKNVTTTIGSVVKESDSVKVDVITEGKRVEDVEVVEDKKITEAYAVGAVAGAVTETIVADKETLSAVETILKEADSVAVEVVADDKKAETIVDKTKVEKVVSDIKSREVEDDKEESVTDAIKEITTGIVAGAAAIFGSGKKDTSKDREVVADKNDTTKKVVVDKKVSVVEEKTEKVERPIVTEEEVISVAIGSAKRTTESKSDVVVSTDSQVVEDVEVTITGEKDIATKVVSVTSETGETAVADIEVKEDVTKAEVHGEKDVTVVVEDSKVVVDKDTKMNHTQDIAIDAGAAIGAVIVGDVEKQDTSKTTVIVTKETIPVEQVEVINHVEKVADAANSWFSRFIEKITSMIEIGDCVEDVDTVIASEESNLQAILEKSKAQTTTGIEEIDVYYSKLNESIKSQISNIKTTVKEAYTEGDASQKISLHLAKEEFKKAVVTQVEETKQVVYEKAKPETVATQNIEAGSDTSIAVVAVSDKPTTVSEVSEVTTDVVYYETVEEAQKKTKEVMTTVVQDTQSKLVSWYDVLFSKIRGVIASTEKDAAEKKKEIQRLITDANKEASVIITEAKKSLEFDYTVSDKCDSKVNETVQVVQKQAIESFENIEKIVSTQISAVEEIVVSEEDLEVIEEKVSVIETQSKRRATVALETTAESAISVGFEGKSVTWIETTEFPASFKDVKVFAFDLFDTVYDYRLTISQVWKTIVATKNASTFAQVDVEKLVVRWYHVFLEQRCRITYVTCDREVLLHSLKLVLAEYSLEDAFTTEELNTLCTAWFKLQLFNDSTSSINKFKQVDGTFAVAISSGFKLCTLMKNTRNTGISWHAQLTGDVFAACISRDNITDLKSASGVVLSNAAMLCCVTNPAELAVVSSNPEILEVAKQNGSKTVLIDRYDNTTSSQEYDIQFDGLDIFAESYETFVETKTVAKTEVPATRSWFQRVVSTVANTAESVSHALIG